MNNGFDSLLRVGVELLTEEVGDGATLLADDDAKGVTQLADTDCVGLVLAELTAATDNEGVGDVLLADMEGAGSDYWTCFCEKLVNSFLYLCIKIALPIL